MALVVPNKGTAVVLDDGRELGGRKPAVADPAWELVVPHAVVPAEQLAVALRELRNLVTARKGERALRRLRRVLQDKKYASEPYILCEERTKATVTLTHFMLFAGVIWPNW